MVQSLHEISTKALMQRIADELEGLIVADAEGRYAYVNQRWSSLTGYTFEQVSDCRKQPGDSENEARNCLCSAVLFHGFD